MYRTRRKIKQLSEPLEPIFSITRYLLEKYFLVFRTIPFFIIIIACKIIVDTQTSGGLMPPISFLGNIIAASFFLFGFVLSANITEFRHGEKLPGEIVAHLEPFIDLSFRLKEKRGKDFEKIIKSSANLSKNIRHWLYKKISTDDMYKILRDFISHFREMSINRKISEKSYDVAISERNEIRQLVVEVDMIRKTTFVSAGYVIGELFSIFIIGILLITKFENEFEGLIVTGGLSFLFIYILFLIHDLDNPFSYSENEKLTSRVNLIQLKKFENRCENLLKENRVKG